MLSLFLLLHEALPANYFEFSCRTPLNNKITAVFFLAGFPVVPLYLLECFPHLISHQRPRRLLNALFIFAPAGAAAGGVRFTDSLPICPSVCLLAATAIPVTCRNRVVLSLLTLEIEDGYSVGERECPLRSMSSNRSDRCTASTEASMAMNAALELPAEQKQRKTSKSLIRSDNKRKEKIVWQGRAAAVVFVSLFRLLNVDVPEFSYPLVTLPPRVG